MSKKNPTTEALEKLSDTYGTSPDKLHDALQKQAELNASLTISQLSFFVGVHIVCSFAFFMWYKSTRKRHTTDTEDIVLPLCLIGLILFTIGLVIAIPVALTDVFTSVHNPDYWIYQQIQAQLEDLD